ncbi:Alpha/Beta hydrolase protein [Tirmania nivea]|nr:Alpha/Beta hydrolase protein [Tirmania nivea]
MPEEGSRWHEVFSARSRWALELEAATWRQLSNIGFFLHRYAPPIPPPPNFTRTIPITVSPRKEGQIELLFWTPEGYTSPSFTSGTESVTEGTAKLTEYPMLINFHGGGFTIGTSMDDVRWAHACVSYLNCVFVSVEYRLAPQHPFPTAVEDGADACLWLVDHAKELSLDANRMATTGFSAGGNMAFTVCMRVREEEQKQEKEIHEGKIVAIASFYPSTDFTLSRDIRRLSILRKDKSLPAFFTDLFDASYLHPPKSIALDDKYLSPGLAPTEVLRNSLPEDIILYSCEWDELLVEGERFATRLGSEEVGKRVRYRCIMNARHGWDKSPLPWQGKDERRDSVYREVCNELGKVFYGTGWQDLGETELTNDENRVSTQPEAMQ